MRLGLTDKYCSVLMVHYPSSPQRVNWMRRAVDSVGKGGFPYEFLVTLNPSDDKELTAEAWGLLRSHQNAGGVTLLLANRDNMRLAWSRNQLLPYAAGEYIAVVDDDIEFSDGWLRDCVECIRHFAASGVKVVATPLIIPQQDKPWQNLGVVDGFRESRRAGSNVMVMTRASSQELGSFPYYQGWRCGCEYHDRIPMTGHRIFALPENKAEHLGYYGSINKRVGNMPIVKTLASGEELTLWMSKPKEPDELRYINRIPGWMRSSELRWLIQEAAASGSVVEIGSWKGRSTHALLTGCPGTVWAVDTWSGSPGEDNMLHEAASKDVYKEFMENVGSRPNLKVIRDESVHAAKSFADGSVGMVFIDGDHRYEAVLADIDAWKRVARRLICGHDFTKPGVRRAVLELCPDAEVPVGSIWAAQAEIPRTVVTMVRPAVGGSESAPGLKLNLSGFEKGAA